MLGCLSKQRPPQNHDADEFKLPKKASMVTILLANMLLQVSFFIIVSSSNDYAKHLGGGSTFAGIVIGIPTVFSGIALVPMMQHDRGQYKLPLHVSCAASILGHVLYACAYKANYLYLILIGRIVSGISFSMWMYCKRYCSDGRIVGIRRRTTLAGALVLGQGVGMTAGPFFGGLITKIGFNNAIFNGYTGSGWIMAGDVEERSTPETKEMQMSSVSDDEEANMPRPSMEELEDTARRTITPPQWGVIVCMCWCAMTCFFILGAWESNIPVFSTAASPLHLSPFGAGNFIALGGLTTFPFLIANLAMARRLQDRHILLIGASLGLAGLLVFISLVGSNKVNYGSMFVCWWLVALGFNLASTVTVSLLSKQLPQEWNGRTSLAIQYSNYTGRVSGAIWGGSGLSVGMLNYTGLEIAVAGIGALLFTALWRDLKTKSG
ncbi:MFS general substrate transporter [Cylindrobasidium torrendii FP15055 ss-10]|uniref:MFS general substrate transporter n=1 Tax=Cylindrobasidium torrendii FP15055 ss-10 TaxID=1314674 RepID=A0A0D7BKE8_9AGAR|nr:MFS general substrate transporter [Cylindrobasidium torrendii FP15055 ss-10]